MFKKNKSKVGAEAEPSTGPGAHAPEPAMVLAPPMEAEEAERIFDLAPDMLAVAGIDGYFKRLNRAWEETLGYSREELLSRPLFNFIHPDDHESTMEEIKAQVAGKATIHFENRYQCKDGSYRLLSWRATPSEDGLLYSAARDITEERQAEEAFDTILRSTMGHTGQELLDSISENLCKWLGADCVAIGDVVDEDRVIVRSMIMDGQFVKDFEYELRATPYETVVRSGFCMFPEGITKLYPEDTTLVEFNAEGYAGIPLRNASGRVVGVLSSIYRKKLSFPKRIKEIFEILAGRAAAEIERMHAEEKLKVKLDEIERLNHLMVGREFRIEELKKKIDKQKDIAAKLNDRKT